MLEIRNEKTGAVESWREIDEFGGLYFISENGEVFDVEVGCKMPYRLDKDKYKQYTLKGLDGKNKTRRANRLVAEAFVYNDDPKNKTEVSFIDGDRTNLHYTNLEWLTKKDLVNKPEYKERRLKSLEENKIYDNVPVIQRNMDYKIIGTYKNYKEASKQTGLRSDRIRRCCQKINKQFANCYWEFAS